MCSNVQKEAKSILQVYLHVIDLIVQNDLITAEEIYKIPLITPQY